METLSNIERRLMEIEEEKPRRIHNARENYSGSWDDEVEAMDIAQLDTEKAILGMKRQFILDSRDGWKARIVWSFIVPIVSAVITAYIVARFNYLL